MNCDGGNWTLRVAQLALTTRGDEILLASVAAPQTAALGFRAAMNMNSPVSFELRELELRYFCRTPRKVAGQGKYHVAAHRLQYGTVQVTVWVKDPQFLPCISEEAFWQVITKPPYTTPVIRSWAPWLMQALEQRGLIEKLNCSGCDAGLMLVEPETLDELVSEGLREKLIRIPG